MFKKILSFALVVAMLMSVAMIAASAAQVEVTAEAADGVAEVGADADVAATEAANTLSFDPNGSGWQNYSWIAFHIWAIDDDSFEGYDWGGKKQRGTDEDGDGVWTYDLDAAGLNIQSGHQYCVIFYNDNGMQTYNLLFGTDCIGKTASCNGTTYENPEDSNKTALAAFWGGGISADVYGPELKISSIGTVVGTCCAASTTPYEMFVKFLTDTLGNARTYSGKNDQDLLDDTAIALKIGQTDIEKAIKEANVTVEWDKSKSKAEKESDPEAVTPKDDTTTDTTGNKTTPSNNKTTKTGQETTVLFIMLGVMAAAAGVIIFARKKETA